MATYIAKRLLVTIPTLIGITMVTFLIIRLAPGDPVAARLGSAGAGPAATAGGAGEGQVDRERQIVRTKVRLGLLAEEPTVRVWNAAGGEEVAMEHDLSAEVRDIAFAAGPDAAYMALALADGTIAVREHPSGRRIARLEGHERGVNAIAFSADAALLASASDDKTARVWNVERGTEVAVCRGHRLLVRCVDFSPAGGVIATGSRDGTVRLWRAGTGEEAASADDHDMEVTGVRFVAGGSILVSASRDRRLVIRNARTLRPLRPPLDCAATISALAVSPGGDLAAVGLGNNAVALVSLETTRIAARLEGHTSTISSLAFSGDGRFLASAGEDRSIRIWEIPDGTLLRALGGHTGGVTALAFAPDGALASAALDINEVPLLASYGGWLARLARLDFGTSFKDGRPVWDKIAEALPVTLELNILSIIVMYLLSIPLGIFSAARRGSVADEALTVVLFLLYSMPSFWVATMLIIVFGSPAGPTGGILPFVNFHGENAGDLPFLAYLRDHIAHLILPVAALTYASFAFLSRIVRTSMLEVLSQDYVRTARAKGLPEKDVIGRHAFRNSLIPVVTIFGNLLPAMIGGSVIIEFIFTLPGMGSLGFEAILQRDYPVIMAITTLVAVLTMVGILISDLLYCAVDPRIKLE